MIFLSRLTLKQQLLIILLPALLGVLYFSWSSVSYQKSKITSLNNIAPLVDIAAANSLLVHELQKERGATAGFLGSKGADFGDILSNQRESTMAAKATREALLNQNQNIDPNVLALLKKIDSKLAELNSVRKRVDTFSITLKEALTYYTGLNTDLLSISADVAALAEQGQLANQMQSYYNFLQGKERAGIERAVLSNVFSKNQFTPELFKRFVTLVTEQNAYLDTFYKMATQQDRQYYEDSMQVDAVMKVKALRALAFEKAEVGNFDVDSTEWFKQATGRINQLKMVEDYLSEGLKGLTLALKTEAKNAYWLAIFVSLAVILVACGLSLFIIRSILFQVGGEISYIKEVAREIGNGNLKIEVAVKPEDTQSILASINSIKDKLISITMDLKENTSLVNSAAKEISMGNLDLARRTEQMAANLEKTVNNMEEIKKAVEVNTNSASKADEMARNASEVAIQGGVEVEKVVKTMAEISESSDKIVDIISVIESIAFQTNILALNAAVEAARAGEQGRGFAVVASEVRSLAQRSSTAAKEIKDLIDDSALKVQSGAKLVDGAGKTMESIVSAVNGVTAVINEISVASGQQFRGVSNVTSFVGQIDENTQQNAALVEEVSAASTSLEQQSHKLVDSIAIFKIP